MVTSKYGYVLDPPVITHSPRLKATRQDALWDEISTLCKAYPNLWFVIPNTPCSYSGMIRKGKPDRYFAPAGSFETTMRDSASAKSGAIVGTMYVRYVG